MSPLIVAHRGANRLERENTIEAFLKAVELGADAVELDVRETADGELAVFHDKKINGKIVKNISFQELFKTAKELYGIKVPKLEEVLILLKNRARVQIEIKATGYEYKTAKMALSILDDGAFFIFSFNLSSLKAIKIKFPQIQTGFILELSLKRFFQTLVFILFKNKFSEFIDLFAINIKLWQLGFAEILPKKKLVSVWTVNENNTISKLLLNKELYALTTDDCGLALRLKKDSYEGKD